MSARDSRSFVEKVKRLYLRFCVWLHRTVKPAIQQGYALRYPLIALLVLISLGPIASRFANTLYVERTRELLVLSTINLLAVVTSIVVWRRLLQKHRTDNNNPQPLPPWRKRVMLGATVAAAITPIFAFRFSQFEYGLGTWDAKNRQFTPATLTNLAAILAGLLLGWLVMFLFELLSRLVRIWRRKPLTKGYFFPFAALLNSNTEQENATDAFDTQLAVIVGCLWAFLAGAAHLKVRYITGGLFDASLLSVPALLVLAVWILALLLSGISSAVDAWRFPIAAVIIVWVMVSKFVNRDQLQPVSAATSNTGSAAQTDDITSAVAESVTPESGQSLAIVVTCPGGGIHAAAWAYTVLHGLNETEGLNFHERLKFVSAVSGGAFGAAVFLEEAYHRDLREPNGNNGLQRIPFARGGLNAVANGLVYDDLFSAVTMFPTKGRGQRLEDFFSQYVPREVSLARWADGRPELCFGSMDVTTGRRVLFTTSDALTGLPGQTSKADARLGHTDFVPPDRFSPAAAARASAAFPYVSPVVNVAGDGDQKAADLQLVDGGYFDNEGILSALAWIKKNQKCYDRIVLLRIEPSPEDSKDKSPLTPELQWLLGPVKGVLAMRTASQEERGDYETRWVADALPKVEVHTITFQLPPGRNSRDIPLSWSLTPRQESEMLDVWQTIAPARIRQFQDKLSGE